MLVIGGRAEQSSSLLEVGADRPVGRVELRVDHRQRALVGARQPRPVGAVAAVGLDHELGPEPMRLAQLEVVLAMVGRHVDEAGAAVGGDEVARQERPRLGIKPAAVVHRVAGDGAGEVRASVFLNYPWINPARPFADFWN